MDAQDQERWLADTEFAARLRSQFEGLAETRPEPRRRRHWVIAAAGSAVAVAVVASIALIGGFDSTPMKLASPHADVTPSKVGGLTLSAAPDQLPGAAAIAAKAVGIWRETDTAQGYRLTIRRDPRATGRVWYTVTYPRSFKVPFPASLDGQRIKIWGENAISDVVWIVSYEEDTDTLTVKRPNGAEAHTFKRLSGSSVTAPKWLIRQAHLMAASGKATHAWWATTSLERALRAVEPGHWKSSSGKGSRPAYLLVMEGRFTPWSYPGEPGPEPVAWAFEVIDPRTHLVDEAGSTDSTPRTDALELREIDLAPRR